MAKSKFEEKAPIVLGFLSEGYTIKEAAQKSAIDDHTVFEWMRSNPSFFTAVQRARKDGEKKAIAAVESSLLDLAKGFEYEEITTEYESQKNPDWTPEKGGERYIPVIKKQRRIKKRVIPSIEAIKFYLTNKAPEEWKNRLDQNTTGNLVTDLRITSVQKSPDDAQFPSSEDEVDGERG